MIKAKKTSYSPINMGISLMLVVFIVLCMVVFSVLSLSTALKDYRYSKTNAENTTEYYAACNQAELKLAQIKDNLSTYDENEIIEYVVPINDSKSLQVVIELHPSENSYTIKTWKSISTITWEGDDTISVLGSEKQED